MTIRFHIRTYGCQMNQRDSEAMTSLLLSHGYEQANGEEDADLLIFNTCSVREQAENKVIGKVGLMKRNKKRNPDLIIGIVGCMAQNYGQKLCEKLEHLDFVLGTDRIHLLPDVVDEIRRGKKHVVETSVGDEILGKLKGHVDTGASAFISVMRGCNQFCSYCIVPYVRGREKSRSIDDVVEEATQLVDKGVTEIFLLGQNVTAYGLVEARKSGSFSADMSPFAELLQAVNQIDGVRRIRFTSPHPKFMNRRFIEAVTTLPKVCEQFHLPLQSGSDPILSRMRRGYTVEEYMNCVDEIRRRKPNVAFSTDIIVGFPGETDEDFEGTRRVMQQVQYDMAYIFKYSPRKGTKAAEIEDSVPQKVKEERNQILLKELEKGVIARNEALVGEEVEVLIEGQSPRNEERWSGRSRTNKVCIFSPVEGVCSGEYRRMKIDRTTAHSLFGTLVD